MKQEKNRASVKLRSKPTKDGGRSLYLDIYHKGVRRYEFLHLYLLPETTRQARIENRTTKELADAILAKRIVEVHDSQFGFQSYERADADFYEYLERTAKERQKHGTATTTFAKNLKVKLQRYCNGKSLSFAMIDKQFLVGFISFLHTKKAVGKRGRFARVERLSESSVQRYCDMMNVTLNSAVRDDIIPYNPMKKVPREALPRPEQAEKSYLTEEELRSLYATHTPMRELTRTMFLFGCATGLRYSDIATLQWRHLTEEADGTIELSKRQVKTGRTVSFPLSEAAKALLPKKGKQGDFVFGNGDIDPRPDNRSIRKWAKAAGVQKHISFHSSRHTFATLALSKGVDLYTVSKMLGHTNIEQTQVYAKVIDSSKRKAAAKMPTFGHEPAKEQNDNNA